ncbi:hypothetical protein NPIL_284351, partial [Nephila pilipes]
SNKHVTQMIENNFACLSSLTLSYHNLYHNGILIEAACPLCDKRNEPMNKFHFEYLWSFPLNHRDIGRREDLKAITSGYLKNPSH